MQASRASDTETLQSQVNKAAKKRLSLSGLEILHGRLTHMGQLSEEGLEIPQDFANARQWYEKAAALGNAASMNNLADLYRYGRGVAPDLTAAANWYLKRLYHLRNPRNTGSWVLK